MDSSPEAPVAEAGEWRDWAELPWDVLSMVFRKLGALDVLWPTQCVCRPWQRASRDPDLWRVVDMRFHADLFNQIDMEMVARAAIDRAAGRLQEYYGEYCASDHLLRYIADRTRILKCLRLISCYDVSDEGLMDIVSRSPLLEELEITFSSLSEGVYESVGKLCPQLKHFRLNRQWYSFKFIHHDIENDSDFEIEYDAEALAIANTMHELRQLQLVGNQLTNKGLLAILDNCPHLESIDIRCCYNVNVDKSLRGRLAKIKNVRLPKDSTADYEFIAEAEEFDKSDLYRMSTLDDMFDDVYYYDDYYDISDDDDDYLDYLT